MTRRELLALTIIAVVTVVALAWVVYSHLTYHSTLSGGL